MSERKIQLEAALLVKDDCSYCLQELRRVLSSRTGIEEVHVTSDPPQLCLHFDPNLVSVSVVERMARDAGGEIEGKFRHQRFRLISNHSADVAEGLERELERAKGVLHASVNLAASLVSVAYDADLTQPEELERTLSSGGVEVSLLESPCCGGHKHHRGEREEDRHDAHSHGHGGCCGHGQDAGHDREHRSRSAHSHSHEHVHGVGCEHGAVPSFLPLWLQQRWQLALVALCGIFLLLGWLGPKFFGWSEQFAVFCFVLSYLTGSYDIATHAIPGLFRGRFNTDILMLAAAMGAAVLGEWLEGAFLLFLFSLGHAGEHYALDRARNAINALGELMPRTAMVKREGELLELSVTEVRVGELAVVRPGDRIPVDGSIVAGSSLVDQSPITGESNPVSKEPGSQVFAGTVNFEGALEVRVEKPAEDSTLSRVVQMVAEAQEQKSPTQDFTQRFTKWFVPSVLTLTILVMVIPPMIGWMDARDSFYRAMLLLVACSPCALALGTPAAVLAGIGQAARNGVLIKGGVHLENLGSLQVMAFDKTGTLTEGRFEVTDLLPEEGSNVAYLLSVAASVEQQSNHPLAKAVVERSRREGLKLIPSSSVRNHAGLGVQAELEGDSVWLGSRKLFHDREGTPQISEDFASRIAALEEQGKTVIVVAHRSRFLGLLALADTPRPRAKEALERLRQAGLKHLVMLTGDNPKSADLMGARLGVTDIRAGLLPEQKWKAGQELRERFGTLAMVGDGVNDAPALAAADVGIAMGGAGTAVALETADVALMGDDLTRLPYAVALSRKSRRIIRQNLALSMGVIAVLMVTSLSGIGELSWTVVFHEGSTLAVVANALRLLSFSPADT